MKLFFSTFVLLLLTTVPALAQEGGRGRMTGQPAEARNDATKTLNRATAALKHMTTTGGEQAIQDKKSLVSRAKCVAIFPEVTKVALGIGGRGGNGVATCKGDNNQWSKVSFVHLMGGSIGAQLGATESQIALFIMDDRAEQKLKDGSLTLGAELQVAAGDWDRGVSYQTGPSVVALSSAKGLMAAAAFDSTRISPNEKLISSIYGGRPSNSQLLGDYSGTNLPPEAQALIDALRV